MSFLSSTFFDNFHTSMNIQLLCMPLENKLNEFNHAQLWKAKAFLFAEVHHQMERQVSRVQMERMIVLCIHGLKALREGDSYRR